MTALAGAPALDFSSKEIVDITAADPVSDMVGRAGFVSNLTVDGCRIPADRGGHEPSVFDRLYWGQGDDEPVLVDICSGGSAHEITLDEESKHVALKRAWAKVEGLRYVVYVDPLLAEFS